MLERYKCIKPDLSFLPKVLILWSMSAIVLLLVCSAAVSRIRTDSSVLGYISSAISFASAALASAYAAGNSKYGAIIVGLCSALVLIIVLLTAGMIISGRDLDAAAIISVVSFTVSGSIFGSVFLKPGNRKSKFTKAKKRR